MPKIVDSLGFLVHGERTINYELLTMNRRRRRLGYTLVEFLIVIGLLGIAVGSLLLILTSTLKGSNQSNVTAEVRQYGQVVLDSLERQIRNADSVQSVGSEHIVVYRPNFDPLHIKCFESVPLTSNGWIGLAVSQDSFPADDLYKSLTNKDDLVGGVDLTAAAVSALRPISSVPSCAMNVIAGTANSPGVVSIEFVVNQAVKAPSRKDFLANANFQTTISLRNY